MKRKTRKTGGTPKAGAALWGGRFRKPPSPEFERLGNSFRFDWQLLPFDIAGSIAWAGALREAGVLGAAEERAIVGGLREIVAGCSERPDAMAGEFDRYEDVHSFVEASLVKLAGDAGRKLHTGRSRNDQVALDFRMYVRDECRTTIDRLKALLDEILAQADRYRNAPMPAFTHLQHAQPVLAGHWWLAWFEMFMRDISRFARASESASVMPLGSGAVAGTGFAVDRVKLAAKLGFERVSDNSIDAVADRDFALDYLYAVAVLMMHLSRLAEDVIIFSTPEFGYISLDDSVTSGSSLMPQKKNPDTFELVRGKSGRASGNLERLLVVLKGLPLAYNRDMQEDKEAVFDSAATAAKALDAVVVAVKTLTMNTAGMSAAAAAGHANATELADYLVRRGVPFRSAHEAAGKLVLAAIEKGVALQELPLDVLREAAPVIDGTVVEALTTASCLESRCAKGGTSPARVAEAVRAARRRLGTLG
ncbi:MAG: argininosuccinate lyase [Myxococcota bacterium]|jgi:argininosuccinate lyase